MWPACDDIQTPVLRMISWIAVSQDFCDETSNRWDAVRAVSAGNFFTSWTLAHAPWPGMPA